MTHFKKLNEDGSINMIGTQDEVPIDAVEITGQEYTELYEYIRENAVHIIDESDEEDPEVPETV